MRKIQTGFTLIEMMVTVLIIGILASIAYPEYSKYVIKGKLAQVEALMRSTALPMKGYFADSRTYDNAGSCAITMPTNEFVTFPCATSNSGNDYLITADSKAGVGLGAAGDYSFTMDKDVTLTTVKFNGATINHVGFKTE